MFFDIHNCPILVYSGLSLGTLSNGLPLMLPPDFLSNHVAILGQTGTGKTRLAMKLVTEAERHGLKLLIIDVEGEWKNIIPHLHGDIEYALWLAKFPFVRSFPMFGSLILLFGLQHAKQMARLTKPSLSSKMEVKNMVEFETVQSKEIALNSNGSIEATSKIAITDEGTTEFISITKGFDRDGNRKLKQILTVPTSAVDELVEALKSVV